MSTNAESGGEEELTGDEAAETDEWVEERRDELERLANSDYNSAWVAEKMLQFDEEEGDS